MSLSSLRPAIQLVERSTKRTQPVLTDQFEYAYLAHRPSVADYFWDMRSVIDARSLERRLRGTAAVVGTGGGGSYPPGFITYLAHRHYPHTRVGGATIWLLSADDDAPGELALSSHTGH
jgi:hypothetical protein